MRYASEINELELAGGKPNKRPSRVQSAKKAPAKVGREPVFANDLFAD